MARTTWTESRSAAGAEETFGSMPPNLGTCLGNTWNLNPYDPTKNVIPTEYWQEQGRIAAGRFTPLMPVPFTNPQRVGGGEY